MSKRPSLPRYAAGLIQRHDQHYLILRPLNDDSATWRFPRGPVATNESPEACMRRLARECFSATVEIEIGQPPVVVPIDGRPAELRFFMCHVTGGSPETCEGEELRWILKAHFREYDFDDVSKPVAEWLLED